MSYDFEELTMLQEKSSLSDIKYENNSLFKEKLSSICF